MSKYVKNLVTRDIQKRLEGVEDAVVVSYVGLDANRTNELRGTLQEKGIQMMLVKNSLARRATEGTSLGPMFEEVRGSRAICWGATDFVTLVKEVVALDRDQEKFDKFTAEAGVLDGDRLDSAGLAEVSSWPSREEQISLLVGQILGPGAQLSGAMLGPGRTLAGQVDQKSEEE